MAAPPWSSLVHHPTIIAFFAATFGLPPPFSPPIFFVFVNQVLADGAILAERGGAAVGKELVVDVAGDPVDNINDLLDFLDDANAGGGVLGGCGRGSDLLCSGALLPAKSGSGISGPDRAADDDLGEGLYVPTEDVQELDWLSSFVEDSFSAGSSGLKAVEEDRRRCCHKDGPFQTSSPISVLDSTSSPSLRKRAGPFVIPSRARSKLPRRPATCRFRRPLLFVSPTSSTDETNPHSSLRAHFLNCSNLSLESDSIVELSERKKMAKKTKKKQKLFVAAAASDEVAQPVRKCTHCEIQKTPQWRAGPMGPKTLCNACGVRHKSGGLFPEYRPAASPTFVRALHSNSHKKVLEMRDQMGQKDPTYSCKN